MVTVYKKIYVNTVDKYDIAEKERDILLRSLYDAGIDEVVEDGMTKFKIYYMSYAGNTDL